MTETETAAAPPAQRKGGGGRRGAPGATVSYAIRWTRRRTCDAGEWVRAGGGEEGAGGSGEGGGRHALRHIQDGVQWGGEGERDSMRDREREGERDGIGGEEREGERARERRERERERVEVGVLHVQHRKAAAGTHLTLLALLVQKYKC